MADENIYARGFTPDECNDLLRRFYEATMGFPLHRALGDSWIELSIGASKTIAVIAGTWSLFCRYAAVTDAPIELA